MIIEKQKIAKIHFHLNSPVILQIPYSHRQQLWEDIVSNLFNKNNCNRRPL